MHVISQPAIEALQLQQSLHQQWHVHHHPHPQTQPQSQQPPQQQQALLQQYVARQQRWILFMRHCCQCRDPEQACLYGTNCSVGRQLLEHILTCHTPNCAYPRCSRTRQLLKHHQKCQATTCPVCVPVKDYLQQVRQQQQSTKSLLEPSAINEDIQQVASIFPSEFDAILRLP